MSIIYTVIARGSVMLVDYTPYGGNFVFTAEQILKMCSPNRKYVKYAAKHYIFYVLYIDFIYLVMCDTHYSQKNAFSYLERVKKLFMRSVSVEKAEWGGMYSCSEFQTILKETMELYTSPEQEAKIAKFRKASEDFDEIISQDLQQFMNRGQTIEVLVKKTETMASLNLDLTSSTIKKVKLRKWKKRITIGLGLLVVIGIAYLTLVLLCGNFDLFGCS